MYTERRGGVVGHSIYRRRRVLCTRIPYDVFTSPSCVSWAIIIIIIILFCHNDDNNIILLQYTGHVNVCTADDDSATATTKATSVRARSRIHMAAK